MVSQPSTFNFQRRANRGFALIIIITLLVFLVLLLIGLATVTRVETAVAGNTQRQAQARENALLALNLAVAHLQKYAGRDQTVTATADAFGGTNSHFTGVWDATATGTAPMTWLVSGNEVFDKAGVNDPLVNDPTKAYSTTGTTPVAVELVGKNSAGTAGDVVAPLVDIKTFGIPGQTSNDTTTAGGTRVGRYAWWIGDQGVKAPIALGDPTATASNFNYDPYQSSADTLSRIRQQIALGAGAANADGTPAFEPRDANNSALVANGKVSAFNQVAFLKNSANTALGLTSLQKNFHTWSPNNLAVLANTKLGGLRQDLSIDPTQLGTPVQNWLNYSTYTEAAVPGTTGAPSPDYGTDPIRRRVLIQAGPPTISPVVTFFLISFNVRTQGGSSAVKPIEVRARWMLTMWNPYTSAFAEPQDLRLEVTGLPNLRVDNETTGLSPAAAFSLHSVYGSPLNISLPWNSSATAGSASDRASWLPGRVYTWTALEDLTGNPPPAAGYASNFYSRNINGDAGQGVQHLAPTAVTIDGDNVCHIDGDAQTLHLTLYAVRSGGDEKLATFDSPAFDAFSTTPLKLSSGSYQFTYVFRLGESLDGAPWLTTAGVDPHSGALPANAYVYQATVSNPSNPAGFVNYTTISSVDRLFDRATNSYTYNEDAPVFELPRSPVLSVGALQHVALSGQRPFAIGNSWAAATVLNNSITAAQAFDQFFFSGLVSGVTPAAVKGSLVVPNPLLGTLRNSATSAATTLADLQAVPNAQSAKFFLSGGAFNLNSTNSTAWAAMLRAVRFPAPQSFSYLDADSATGSADDSATATVQSTDAQFLRFAQSAQETFKADAGSSGGAAATELFRQGMRNLTGDQVATLAAKITAAIATHNAQSGPFRSLEEFLSPASSGTPSLLEQAIADAGINSSVAEFSSQFLTQGDIMTALAPVLFPRSDTFVVRTYGEAVNPITSASEGRAWCEAIVQRIPDYYDTADAAETAPAALTSTFNPIYGRRFKVVSFRWLTRSDI